MVIVLCFSFIGWTDPAQQVAFPTQRISGPDFSLPNEPNFVGNTGDFAIAIECPEDCRPTDHKDWKLC